MSNNSFISGSNQYLFNKTIYEVMNAPILGYPYSHIHLSEIFHPKLYEQMLENLPLSDEMLPITVARGSPFPDRFVLDLDEYKNGAMSEFWRGVTSGLRDKGFAKSMLNAFRVHEVEYRDEFLLVNDRSNYCIGPHTDSPRKILTAIFYLPQTNNEKGFGTTLYSSARECAGRMHHPFDSCEEVMTIPYKRNSMFAFAKTERSWHGVKPFPGELNRWILIYDAYRVA